MTTIFTLFLLLLSPFKLHAEAMLYPMQGKPFPFSSLHGKWVLINYWASWCEPCLEEIPELNRFYQQQKHKNTVLFAVNFDMVTREEQKTLHREFHLSYPGLVDDPAEVLKLGDIRGVPVTFVFNPEGVLTETLYGGQTVSSLNGIVE
jgi:thiol-disulfide isomerase/thioredoxin